jgi:hypothetical protein
MERKTRFELATLALARRCSTTELLPHRTIKPDGGETQNRTGDTRIFSPLLYHLSYLAIMAELTGIEPAVSGVTGRHVNRYTTAPHDATRNSHSAFIVYTNPFEKSTRKSIPVVVLNFFLRGTVIDQALQFNGQIGIVDIHIFRHLQLRRGKVKYGFDAVIHQDINHFLS